MYPHYSNHRDLMRVIKMMLYVLDPIEFWLSWTPIAKIRSWAQWRNDCHGCPPAGGNFAPPLLRSIRRPLPSSCKLPFFLGTFFCSQLLFGAPCTFLAPPTIFFPSTVAKSGLLHTFYNSFCPSAVLKSEFFIPPMIFSCRPSPPKNGATPHWGVCRAYRYATNRTKQSS